MTTSTRDLEATADGKRRGERALRGIEMAIVSPDALAHELLDALIADGYAFPATPARFRAFCRVVQQRLQPRKP